jgi:hypothetical protein
VLVGGSVARGFADRYSDIEIGVFWDTLPSIEERAAARERAGGVAGDFIPNSGRYSSDDPRSVGGLERFYLGGGAAEGDCRGGARTGRGAHAGVDTQPYYAQLANRRAAWERAPERRAGTETQGEG